MHSEYLNMRTISLGGKRTVLFQNRPSHFSLESKHSIQRQRVPLEEQSRVEHLESQIATYNRVWIIRLRTFLSDLGAVSLRLATISWMLWNSTTCSFSDARHLSEATSRRWKK